MGGMFTIKNGWFMTLLYPHYTIHGETLKFSEVRSSPGRHRKTSPQAGQVAQPGQR